MKASRHADVIPLKMMRFSHRVHMAELVSLNLKNDHTKFYDHIIQYTIRKIRHTLIVSIIIVLACSYPNATMHATVHACAT